MTYFEAVKDWWSITTKSWGRIGWRELGKASKNFLVQVAVLILLILLPLTAPLSPIGAFLILWLERKELEQEEKARKKLDEHFQNRKKLGTIKSEGGGDEHNKERLGRSV